MLLSLLLACTEPALVVTDPPVVAPQVADPAPTEAGVRVDLPDTDGTSTTVQLDRVALRITAHRPRGVPVLTLVTDGLSGDQLAITVRRDRPVDIEPLLQYVQATRDGGVENAPRLWEAAGMAPEGPGFLGQGRFYALYFAAPHPFDGVDGTATAIAAIPWTPLETEWAFKLGPQRILARLAHQGGVFPTVPWGDATRAEVVDPKADASDPSLAMETGLQTSLQATLVDEARLELAIDPVALKQLGRAGVLEHEAFRLFAGRAPDVDGLIVHRPEETDTLVTGGDARSRVGLNGLIVRTGDADAFQLVHDHAELTLTPSTRQALWEALATGAGAGPTIGTMPVTVVAPGWTKLLPPLPPPPEPKGTRTEGVELMLSQADLAARISEEELKTAIGLLEVELINYTASHPAPVPRMALEVVYRADGTVQMRPTFEQPPADADWWPALEKRLATLEVPAVQDTVQFRMQLAF